MGKPWTDKDDEFLRNNYNTVTDKDIANELERTPFAILNRRRVLGLKKDRAVEPVICVKDKIEIRKLSHLTINEINKKLPHLTYNNIYYVLTKVLHVTPVKERAHDNKVVPDRKVDINMIPSAELGVLEDSIWWRVREDVEKIVPEYDSKLDEWYVWEDAFLIYWMGTRPASSSPDNVVAFYTRRSLPGVYNRMKELGIDVGIQTPAKYCCILDNMLSRVKREIGGDTDQLTPDEGLEREYNGREYCGEITKELTMLRAALLSNGWPWAV